MKKDFFYIPLFGSDCEWIKLSSSELFQQFIRAQLFSKNIPTHSWKMLPKHNFCDFKQLIALIIWSNTITMSARWRPYLEWNYNLNNNGSQVWWNSYPVEIYLLNLLFRLNNESWFVIRENATNFICIVNNCLWSYWWCWRAALFRFWSSIWFVSKSTDYYGDDLWTCQIFEQTVWSYFLRNGRLTDVRSASVDPTTILLDLPLVWWEWKVLSSRFSRLEKWFKYNSRL